MELVSRLLVPAVVAATLAFAAVTPAAAGAAGSRQERLPIVAAENFWGSVVAQLAGTHGSVRSIIDSPDTDPHDYEPRPSDARAFAGARLVVVNGAGYDAWAHKLLDADPGDGRRVIDVGKLAHAGDGGNPHLWYSPSIVEKVVARVTSDLRRLDPRHAAYYRQRRRTFERVSLARYHALIRSISDRFWGTPIGASESIFSPLARALGLRLLTPASFLDAISEGAEPTAHDKSTVDAQVERHDIEVFVFNRQNATPDVQTLVRAARSAGIPVASVTETMTPAGSTFQAWQSRQLAALERALTKAATP
ncbi:MAG TPA: zinc ABC transporter substrate-binding protein [Acidimicrobiia bacterium]|nr:zinc ABC transporter substrate-binding protein [Acidimicrobiia bacterium]